MTPAKHKKTIDTINEMPLALCDLHQRHTSAECPDKFPRSRAGFAEIDLCPTEAIPEDFGAA